MSVRTYGVYTAIIATFVIASGCTMSAVQNQPDKSYSTVEVSTNKEVNTNSNTNRNSNSKTIESTDIPQTSRSQSIEETQRYISEMAAAQQLFSDGNYAAVVTETESVIHKSPQNDQAYSMKGFALALQGNAEEGLIMTKKAYELNPRNVSNFYNMAMVYKLMGQLDDAKIWFDKVLDNEPDNTWSVYGIATIYADKYKDKQALEWLERAIKIDPAVKAVARTQDHFERFHDNEIFKQIVAP